MASRVEEVTKEEVLRIRKKESITTTMATMAIESGRKWLLITNTLATKRHGDTRSEGTMLATTKHRITTAIRTTPTMPTTTHPITESLTITTTVHPSTRTIHSHCHTLPTSQCHTHATPREFSVSMNDNTVTIRSSPSSPTTTTLPTLTTPHHSFTTPTVPNFPFDPFLIGRTRPTRTITARVSSRPRVLGRASSPTTRTITTRCTRPRSPRVGPSATSIPTTSCAVAGAAPIRNRAIASFGNWCTTFSRSICARDERVNRELLSASCRSCEDTGEGS